MLFQVQIQPKSFKSVSVYGNCGETTQAHYMTKLYNWLMHDIIIMMKYQQLCFEVRERREGYTVEVIPTIIGCLGGAMKELKTNIK